MAVTVEQRIEVYKLGVGMYDAAVGTVYMDLLAGCLENGLSVDQLYESLTNDASFLELNFGSTDAATNEQFATGFVDQVTGDLMSQKALGVSVG